MVSPDLPDLHSGVYEREICANCDREIGHLDQGYVYENNVVCLECHNRLKKQNSYSSLTLVNNLSQGAVIPDVTEAQVAAEDFVKYAGFWLRLGAMLIDAIILNIGTLIIGFIILLPLVAGGGTTEKMEQGGIKILLNLLGAVIAWVYFALMESSSMQATFGKMALGIIVTDMMGGRISFGRATGRHFAKYISMITLLVGFIMAGYTRKKQALHDMIAGCLIVK
jgi:uncharacterized RDD family membrane protein YckC